MRTESLRKKTIQNVFWSGLGQFGSYGLRYGIFLILAWLLTPDDFGLDSLTTVVVLLAQEVGSLGFEAALIQREEKSELDWNTAFWSTLVLSLVVSGLVYAFSGPLASVLGDMRTQPLLKTLAFIFPFRALVIAPNSQLTRELQFEKLTRIQFLEQLGYGVTALILASLGAGVWSLIWGRFVMVVLRAGLMWSYVDWRPSWMFSAGVFRELIQFGSHSLTSNILTRGLVRVDYFLVGRVLGTEMLGFYTLAAQIAIVPVQRLVGAVQRVAFPALSQVQKNLQRIKSGTLDVLEHLFVLLFPYTLLLLVLSPDLIAVVYGEKWMPAVELIQILSLTGIFTAFDITRAVFFASGSPAKWTWVISSRIALFVILSLGMGLDFGTPGVAVSFVFSIALTGIISMIAVGKMINLSLKELWERTWRPLVGMTLASLTWLGIRLLFPGERAPVQELVLSGGAVLVVYGVFIYPRYRGFVRQAIAGLLKLFRERTERREIQDKE